MYAPSSNSTHYQNEQQIEISPQTLDIDENYEIVTQTLENGIVVEEERQTIQPRINKLMFDTNRDINSVSSNQRTDINENFKTHDIDEQQKFNQFNSKSLNFESKDKSNTSVKKEDARTSNNQKRGIFKPPNTYRSGGDPYQDILTTEPISLLEDSQEVIVFQSDSKNNSPKQNASAMPENSSIKIIENSKSKATSYQMVHMTPQKEPKIEESKNDDNIIYRDSPGPQRDSLTNSIEKKEINDDAILQQETGQDDDSESSGDLFNNNNIDVKDLMPYDQRKDPNITEKDEPQAKSKLNISYEELEDSESQGSGDMMDDNTKRLESIVEEDEEATEYQRSRSRSKSPTLSGLNLENEDESKPTITNETGKFDLYNLS